MPNTPAADAGLADGTLIEAIDGQPTIGRSLGECVQQIRGPAGTSVRLMIVTPPEETRRTVEIVRRSFRT